MKGILGMGSGVPRDLFRLKLAIAGCVLLAGTMGIALAGSGRALAQGGQISVQDELGGRLDETFGMRGIASASFYSGRISSMGIAESSRHQVVQGALGPEGKAGSVVRYSARGHLDKTFGIEGKARLAFKSGVIGPRDILVDRKDRIIVTGESYRRGGEQYGGAIARLLPDGKPDPSFSRDGFRYPPGFEEATPVELAFAHQGKILMVGLVEGVPSSGVFIARFLPNGNLDRSFSKVGYRTVAVKRSQSWRSVVMDQKGRIVLGAGTLRGASGLWTYTVIRLKSNGRLDRSFSGNGRVAADTSTSNDQLMDIAIDPKGRILAAGESSSQGTIFRFLSNGELDHDFGLDGRKIVSGPVASISVDRAGQIIVVGTEEWDGGQIERLRPNGQDDRNFVSFSTGTTSLEDHFIDSEGRIVASGSVSNTEIGVVRVLNP